MAESKYASLFAVSTGGLCCFGSDFISERRPPVILLLDWNMRLPSSSACYICIGWSPDEPCDIMPP